MSGPIPPCGITLGDIQTLDSSLLPFVVTTARQKSCIDNRSLSTFEGDSSNDFVRTLTSEERYILSRFRDATAPGFSSSCVALCLRKKYPEAVCNAYCGMLRKD